MILRSEMQTTIGTKQKIFNVLQQNQSRLSALGVKRIGLFGSFVRGEQRTDSDIDLLVEFEPTRKTFDTFMELSSWKMFYSIGLKLLPWNHLVPILAPIS